MPITTLLLALVLYNGINLNVKQSKQEALDITTLQ